MTENDALDRQIIDDLRFVLKEAKKMGCKEVKCFRDIPIQNVEAVVQALEEIQQYRETGFSPLEIKALSSMEIHNFNTLQKYRAIGTVEECRTAVERMKPRKPLGGADFEGNEYLICQECSEIVQGGDWIAKYCPHCGQAIEWGKENDKE